MLLLFPWSVTLDQATEFPVSSATDVLIPNAACYLAQKILILPKRREEDRAKDVLYVYDTIEVFSRSLDEIKREWVDKVKPTLERKATSRLERAVESNFATVTDTMRQAARVAAASGRSLSAETLQEVCCAGLEAVFIAKP